MPVATIIRLGVALVMSDTPFLLSRIVITNEQDCAISGPGVNKSSADNIEEEVVAMTLI